LTGKELLGAERDEIKISTIGNHVLRRETKKEVAYMVLASRFPMIRAVVAETKKRTFLTATILKTCCMIRLELLARTDVIRERIIVRTMSGRRKPSCLYTVLSRPRTHC